MKRGVIAALVVAVAGLALTGCGNSYDPITEGTRCAKAGGDWVYSSWDGYHCNIYGSRNGGEK